MLSLATLRLAAHQGHGHDDWKPTPYADAAAHAPRPLPDRIVLTWSGDPATTQAVTWRTDISVRRGLAELAVANENGRDLKGEPFPARATDFTSDLGEARYHSVEFTGLAPDTLYAYRVGDGANWSEWLHFRTASREARPFTFVYFGDAQNDLKTHWSRVFREAFRAAPRAAFTLHAGDLINRANRDAEWGEWFGAPAWVNGMVPVVPTPGNHEYFNDGAGPDRDRRWNTKAGGTVEVTIVAREPAPDAEGRRGERLTVRAADAPTAVVTLDGAERIAAVDAGFTALTGFAPAEVIGNEPDAAPLRDRVAVPGVRTLSRHWRPQFTLPAHGPAGLEETCYFLDYQGVRIISLNSNERQADQVAWLRAALAGNPGRWAIVTFHHPIFSPARERDNASLRAAWKPVLDEFKVDLVLTGHDHTYARSGDTAGVVRVGSRNLPKGYNQVYDPAIGTVYVVSVSGPKMYDLNSDEWAVRTAEDTQLFQVVTVDGDELRYEARTATGRLYDAFTLRKRPGRPNELLEHPDRLPPERRRPAASP
jgi:3',5'-cyclic AMP phosphodiesterase CpdA